jgi:hypothetical protein
LENGEVEDEAELLLEEEILSDGVDIEEIAELL